MTVRGTRNLLGKEADDIIFLSQQLSTICVQNGFQRFIPSTLAELELFKGQMGDNRLYGFNISGRDLVLTPEVTAIARREYNDRWAQELPKPVKLYYTHRCYRYDRPQRGRYREFTQFGIESMPTLGTVVTLDLLVECLRAAGLHTFDLRQNVTRGLGYYEEYSGFEVWAKNMQIAGGGSYDEGIGWAIGLERLLLAIQPEEGS